MHPIQSLLFPTNILPITLRPIAFEDPLLAADNLSVGDRATHLRDISLGRDDEVFIHADLVTDSVTYLLAL